MFKPTETSSDEEMGFAKPPKRTQFKKGHSGNPNGRPKRSKNLSTLLAKEMRAPTKIIINGKTVSLPKIEVILRQMVNKAMSGDYKAADRVIGLIDKYPPDGDDNLDRLFSVLQQGFVPRGQYNE